jgi:hypothetical protein
VSEPNRFGRILEGLATQLIWQVLVLLTGAVVFSLGAARLSKAVHVLSTSLSVFLVVVELGIVGWALGVVPRRTKNYAKSGFVSYFRNDPSAVQCDQGSKVNPPGASNRRTV